MRRKSSGAFTILEVLLASSFFLIVSGVIVFALRQSTQVFNRVSGNFDALSQLRRVSSGPPKDLQRSKLGAFATKRVTTGSGGHGNALWMLSAVDPADGLYKRDVEGLPIYQRNILYYLVRPNNHAAISNGFTCAIDDASHPNGDPFCPHKIMIRKVIRKEANAADPETLLTAAEVDAYLTAPNGYDLSNMNSEVATPGVDANSIRIAGTRLLSFEIDNTAAPFLRLNFRAVRLREAEKTLPGLGAVDLDEEPLTVEISTSVLPQG
jgi:hypothetical protein